MPSLLIDPRRPPPRAPGAGFQWEPIHAALVLALVLHLVALLAWIVLAPRPSGPALRIVAKVDVVDRIERPRTRRLAPVKVPAAPKVKSPAPRAPSAPSGGSTGRRPAAPTGPPGQGSYPRALPPVRPPRAGGQPSLTGPAYPRAGTRTGEAAGGEGLGDGYGTGAGDGAGGGTAPGAEGGEGAEGPRETTYVTFHIDANGLEPPLHTAPKGDVVFSLVNEGREPFSLKVEGRGGKLYGGQLSAVAPGDTKSFTVFLFPGTYTITVPERYFAPGFVGRLQVTGTP